MSAATIRARLACCALLAGLAAPSARAQDDAILTLHDADAAPLATVMRVDLARRDPTRRLGQTVEREVDRTFKALGADAMTADPLAAVRARTHHFVVPPDARYDADCSRELSRGTLKARAVYAIGRPADDVEAAMRARGGRELTGKDVWALMTAQAQSSAGRAFDAGMKFYKAHGFALQGTVASSATYYWGGATHDPIAVVLYMTNVGAGNGAAACARLGNVALLTLQIQDDGTTIEDRVGATAAAADSRRASASFDAALARTGLDSARYQSLLVAAIMASTDAASTDVLDAIDRIATQEGDARTRAAIAIRRRNVAWYRRHEAEVGPLLHAWGEQ